MKTIQRLALELAAPGLIWILLLIPGAAVTSARGAPFVASGGAQLASGSQAPPQASPWLKASIRAPAETRAEYELFVESRESIKKDPLGSMRLRYRWLELDAGYRWIPGPPGTFLADPGAYSALAGAAAPIPHGRRSHSCFGRLAFAPFLPGIFTVRAGSGIDTGVYLAGEHWFVAAARHRAALTVRGTVPLLAGHVRGWLDVERTREARQPDGMWPLAYYDTHAGYGRLLADRAPEFLYVLLEAERRTRWDYQNPSRHILAVDRQGRSGLGQFFARFLATLEVGAAGQDRGQDGFRVADLAFTPPPAELLPFGPLPGQPVLRARWYHRRQYHDDPNAQSRPPTQHGAAALGYQWTRPGGSVRLLFESRRRGGRTAELQIALGPGARPSQDEESTGWSFRASAVYGHLRAPGEFLFMRAPAEQGAGLRFFGAESGALVLRLRSEFFYLYLESSLRDRKPASFASLQFRVHF